MMALAFKCDSCGKMFESNDEYTRNHIEICFIGINKTYTTNYLSYDCCPKCIDKIINMFNNKEESE